jgi:hypothetical protein
MSTATITDQPANGEATAAAQPQAQATQLPAAPQRQPLVSIDDSEFSALLDTTKFAQLQRVAQLFSASTIVPEHFQGNVSNCFIGLQMAIRLKVDPFMFLQSCYIVHGRPGIEAKLAIALANASGKFRGPIRFEIERDPRTRKPIRCTASATFKETGDVISMVVDWDMVEAEGWNKKTGSKWLTIPEVMFPYRSAMFLLRTHCPEVIMGMQSKEELEDMAAIEVESRPARIAATNLDDLAARLEGTAKSPGGQVAAGASQVDPDDKPTAADRALYLRELFSEQPSIAGIQNLIDRLKGPAATEDWSEHSELIEQLAEAARKRVSPPQGGEATQEWPELAALRTALAGCNSEARVVSMREAWISNHPKHAEAIRAEGASRIEAIKGTQGTLLK